VGEKKIAKSNTFLKKWEGTAVKISAQLEHFSVLVLKVKNTVSHSKFWLFKPIFRHLDPESGSGSRFKLNADPTGSGSDTLLFGHFLEQSPTNTTAQMVSRALIHLSMCLGLNFGIYFTFPRSSLFLFITIKN
jgi:hypothetical protein